jgi:hypothetical protein
MLFFTTILSFILPIGLGVLLKIKQKHRSLLFIFNIIVFFYIIQCILVCSLLDSPAITGTISPNLSRSLIQAFVINSIFAMPLFIIFWFYSFIRLDKVFQPVDSSKVIRFDDNDSNQILDDTLYSPIKE